MKYFYGLIGDSYGFVDSDDERSKLEGLVELTKEDHQQLLDEQSQGREIVFFEGEIFTAPYGLYYLDENKIWHKKDESEYKQELLEKSREQKRQEALNGANSYITSGQALYEFEVGKHIEATDGNISKLGLAAVELVLNQDTESTIEWCSFEDEVVQLNAIALQRIVKGLKNEQARVWVELYPEFLRQIELAKTVEDVGKIVIDYKKLSLKMSLKMKGAIK